MAEKETPKAEPEEEPKHATIGGETAKAASKAPAAKTVLDEFAEAQGIDQ